MEQLKTCSRCGVVKSLCDFTAKLAACKQCIAAYQARRYAANRKAILARFKAHYERSELFKQRQERKSNLEQKREQLRSAGNKLCSQCGKVFPITSFYVDANTRDGRKAHCRLCARAFTKNYARKHSEQVKAAVAAYRKANPEKIKAAVAAWREANAAHMHEYEVNRYRKDPEKFKAKSATWRTANPEKHAAQLAAWSAHSRDVWAKNNPERKRELYVKNRTKYRNELADSYVADKLIRGTPMRVSDIKRYPKLIEAKREIIRSRRIIRTIKETT